MPRRPSSPEAAAALGPGGLALAVAAARRFHLDGASKVQIAQEMGISRFKVAHLLDLAKAAGLVQIVVGSPPGIDQALSDALRSRYGLQHVLVLTETTTDAALQRVRLGRLGCELLEQIVTDHDVVGLAWGRSMSALSDAWAERVPATFVQLAGSLTRHDVPENSPELVNALAARAGGTAVTFYAPLVVADEATSAALGRDDAVSRAVDHMDRLTRAVVSVGAWSEGASTVFDALPPHEQDHLTRLGVCAEVTGLLFRRDGTVVHDIDQRTVCVREDQLRRTDQVIGLAVGTDRAGALAAVLASGLLSGLITHASLAEAVLSADR